MASIKIDFWTSPSLFSFLRRAPHLLELGEGTDRLIAEYAQLSPKASKFWKFYGDALDSVGINDYEDFDYEVKYQIEVHLMWSYINNIPEYLYNHFDYVEQYYDGREILEEEKMAQYYPEIEWEEVVAFFWNWKKVKERTFGPGGVE